MNTALPHGPEANHLRFGVSPPPGGTSERNFSGIASIALGPLRGKDTALAHPDLAETLQARIRTDLEAETASPATRRHQDPHERRTIATLQGQIAALEEAIAQAEILCERRRQEADAATKRVEALKPHIATLEQAAAKSEALAEQSRRQAQATAERVEALEAQVATLQDVLARTESLAERWQQQAKAADDRAEELVASLVAMSKRMAEQTAALEKVRSEFDDYRARPCGWQHATGGGGSAYSRGRYELHRGKRHPQRLAARAGIAEPGPMRARLHFNAVCTEPNVVLKVVPRACTAATIA